nr:CoA transferase [Acinetobacter towneri]
MGIVSQNIDSPTNPVRFNIVPYQVFKAKRGEFIIACGNDQQFQMLCDSIGLPELSQNPKFVKNKDRVTHREEITALLQQHFMTQPAQYWVERIHAVKVPVGMINDLKQALEEEQVISRKMLIRMEHPLRSDYLLIGSPIKLSKTPVQYVKAPPYLGEDTDKILNRFVSEDELKALKHKNIVQQG